LELKIKCLRSNKGEFISNDFFNFYEQHGIKRQFSIAKTPHQNATERMNMKVQQMSCAMLDESGVSHTFLGEVVQIAIDILKKAHIRVNNGKTPHELWYGMSTTIKYFKIFGSKFFIKINDDKLGKFEPRADEGFLLGYSSRSKGFKCYNKRLQNIVESIIVVVNEGSVDTKREIQYDDEQIPAKI